MAEADIRPTGACEQCGTGFPKTYSHKRFCSERCRKKAEVQRGVSLVARCVGCHADYRPKRSDRLTYCSRACAFGAKARAAAAAHDLANVLALEFRGLRLIRTGMPGRLKRIASIRAMQERAKRPCQICAAPVGATRTRTYPALTCSARCAARTDAAREAKKTARKAGKAKKRVATVESVNALRVFERDGWRCHLCGGLTAKAKRGTYDPRAPELDHIVPLSKGGPHSYANTACAHRKCNAAKSDRIVGQPSLLAAWGGGPSDL